MKKMKKFLSILLVVLMLSSMLPAAFAEDEAGESTPAEETAPAVQIIVMEAHVTDSEAVDAQSAESGEVPAAGETAETQPAGTAEASEVNEAADSEADSEEAEADSAVQSGAEPAAAETEAADQDETAEAESDLTDPAAEAAVPDGETQNTAGSGTDNTVQKKGEYSGKTINIQSWDVQKMATNPDYSYLTFTFSSEEDSTVYEACIAGIKISVIDEEKAYAELVTDLLTKVADNFYSDSGFSLSDSLDFSIDYGMSVQPIDAEKIHETATADHPDTDDLLCWAASASDMLQFSGWSKVAVGETFASEDQVFDYFEKSFTDEGDFQYNALKWFFNGAYPDQTTDDTGEVIYGGTGGNAQEKLTYGKNGGVLSDYAEETFEKHYNSATNGYDALYDAALALKDGTATGISVNFYNDDGSKTDGGHALTLLGYIRNTLQTGWEALKALFVSDSDNNKNETQTREEAINSVDMFPLKKKTVQGDSGPVQVLSMENYTVFSDTRITGYCTLTPYTADAAKEETGGKDAVHQLDFTVSSVTLGYGTSSNVKVGDSLQFCTTVENTSYTPLDTANKPYCKVTYTVRCNGEVVAAPTFTYEIIALSGSKMGANSLNFYSTDNAYTPTRAGNYTVSATVDGVYYKDADGNEIQIPEAYTSNNSSRVPCSFTVTGGDTPEPTPSPEPTPEPTPDQPDDDTATDEPANSISVPVWCATITGSADSETGIELKGVYGTGLTLMKNGKVVPAENYTLTFADNGSVIVTFTQDYIDTLLPGVHTFHVLDESGSLIGIIELTVR